MKYGPSNSETFMKQSKFNWESALEERFEFLVSVTHKEERIWEIVEADRRFGTKTHYIVQGEGNSYSISSSLAPKHILEYEAGQDLEKNSELGDN